MPRPAGCNDGALAGECIHRNQTNSTGIYYRDCASKQPRLHPIVGVTDKRNLAARKGIVQQTQLRAVPSNDDVNATVASLKQIERVD